VGFGPAAGAALPPPSPQPTAIPTTRTAANHPFFVAMSVPPINSPGSTGGSRLRPPDLKNKKPPGDPPPDPQALQCRMAMRPLLAGLLLLALLDPAASAAARQAESLARLPSKRVYPGLTADQEGRWTAPFFFIQLADPQFGFMDA